MEDVLSREITNVPPVLKHAFYAPRERIRFLSKYSTVGFVDVKSVLLLLLSRQGDKLKR